MGNDVPRREIEQDDVRTFEKNTASVPSSNPQQFTSMHVRKESNESDLSSSNRKSVASKKDENSFEVILLSRLRQIVKESKLREKITDSSSSCDNSIGNNGAVDTSSSSSGVTPRNNNGTAMPMPASLMSTAGSPLPAIPSLRVQKLATSLPYSSSMPAAAAAAANISERKRSASLHSTSSGFQTFRQEHYFGDDDTTRDADGEDENIFTDPAHGSISTNSMKLDPFADFDFDESSATDIASDVSSTSQKRSRRLSIAQLKTPLKILMDQKEKLNKMQEKKKKARMSKRIQMQREVAKVEVQHAIYTLEDAAQSLEYWVSYQSALVGVNRNDIRREIRRMDPESRRVMMRIRRYYEQEKPGGSQKKLFTLSLFKRTNVAKANDGSKTALEKALDDLRLMKDLGLSYNFNFDIIRNIVPEKDIQRMREELAIVPPCPIDMIADQDERAPIKKLILQWANSALMYYESIQEIESFDITWTITAVKQVYFAIMNQYRLPPLPENLLFKDEQNTGMETHYIHETAVLILSVELFKELVAERFANESIAEYIACSLAYDRAQQDKSLKEKVAQSLMNFIKKCNVLEGVSAKFDSLLKCSALIRVRFAYSIHYSKLFYHKILQASLKSFENQSLYSCKAVLIYLEAFISGSIGKSNRKLAAEYLFHLQMVLLESLEGIKYRRIKNSIFVLQSVTRSRSACIKYISDVHSNLVVISSSFNTKLITKWRLQLNLFSQKMLAIIRAATNQRFITFRDQSCIVLQALCACKLQKQEVISKSNELEEIQFATKGFIKKVEYIDFLSFAVSVQVQCAKFYWKKYYLNNWMIANKLQALIKNKLHIDNQALLLSELNTLQAIFRSHIEISGMQKRSYALLYVQKSYRSALASLSLFDYYDHNVYIQSIFGMLNSYCQLEGNSCIRLQNCLSSSLNSNIFMIECNSILTLQSKFNSYKIIIDTYRLSTILLQSSFRNTDQLHEYNQVRDLVNLLRAHIRRKIQLSLILFNINSIYSIQAVFRIYIEPIDLFDATLIQAQLKPIIYRHGFQIFVETVDLVHDLFKSGRYKLKIAKDCYYLSLLQSCILSRFCSDCEDEIDNLTSIQLSIRTNPFNFENIVRIQSFMRIIQVFTLDFNMLTTVDTEMMDGLIIRSISYRLNKVQSIIRATVVSQKIALVISLQSAVKNAISMLNIIEQSKYINAIQSFTTLSDHFSYNTLSLSICNQKIQAQYQGNSLKLMFKKDISTLTQLQSILYRAIISGYICRNNAYLSCLHSINQMQLLSSCNFIQNQVQILQSTIRSFDKLINIDACNIFQFFQQNTKELEMILAFTTHLQAYFRTIFCMQKSTNDLITFQQDCKLTQALIRAKIVSCYWSAEPINELQEKMRRVLQWRWDSINSSKIIPLQSYLRSYNLTSEFLETPILLSIFRKKSVGVIGRCATIQAIINAATTFEFHRKNMMKKELLPKIMQALTSNSNNELMKLCTSIQSVLRLNLAIFMRISYVDTVYMSNSILILQALFRKFIEYESLEQKSLVQYREQSCKLRGIFWVKNIIRGFNGISNAEKRLTRVCNASFLLYPFLSE